MNRSNCSQSRELKNMYLKTYSLNCILLPHIGTVNPGTLSVLGHATLALHCLENHKKNNSFFSHKKTRLACGDDQMMMDFGGGGGGGGG